MLIIPRTIAPILDGYLTILFLAGVTKNEHGTTMSESLTQIEFKQLIMEVALAACFKADEEFLSEDQILARGYAPTDLFGKSCISYLIDNGAIEFVRKDPAFPLNGNDCSLFIKCPAKMGKDLDSYIFERAEKILSVLARSETHAGYLKAFIHEVTACECIEYCEFYAMRAQLKISNSNHNNAKLRLLLLECEVEKIHMLMWQAIKIINSKTSSNSRCVEFSDIIDITFDRYTHYKKRNVNFEGYKRPSILKPSVLAGFLELYRCG